MDANELNEKIARLIEPDPPDITEEMEEEFELYPLISRTPTLSPKKAWYGIAAYKDNNVIVPSRSPFSAPIIDGRDLEYKVEWKPRNFCGDFELAIWAYNKLFSDSRLYIEYISDTWKVVFYYHPYKGYGSTASEAICNLIERRIDDKRG